MITSLSGQLARAFPHAVEIDVGGVGYEVFIPLSTFDKLPNPPAPCRLVTHLHVTETAHTLYGFATEEERQMFRLLIVHVSGVGPKVALSILSGMAVTQFRAAVAASDVSLLSKIKGIGRKTAEKIIVELRDKVGVSASWEQAAAERVKPEDVAINDAVLALLALGYKQAEAHNAVKSAQTETPGATVEELVRTALRRLN